MSKAKFKKCFLLLKLCDQEIVDFINALKEIFNNEKPTVYPHVTLRGPFENFVPRKDIEEVQKYLSEEDPVIIEGIGMFVNNGNHIIYFKANKKNFEKAIYKKDYPISEYGVNPHITFYKGNNYRKAQAIYNFMNSINNLRLECYKSEIVCYSKKENKLNRDVCNFKTYETSQNFKKTNCKLISILEEAKEVNRMSATEELIQHQNEMLVSQTL